MPVRKRNPYAEANREILDNSKKDERFLPFMMVHPMYDDLNYLNTHYHLFKGFKIYPRSKGMEFSYCEIADYEVMKFLADSKKPVLFHTGYREGERISAISWFAKESTGSVIFAHSGDLIAKDIKIASEYPNVLIDICPLATMIENNFFVSEDRRPRELKGKLTTQKVLEYLKGLFGKRIICGSDSPSCDQLLKDGYLREIEVAKEMKKMGLEGYKLI